MPASGALDGLRVIDAAQVMAGPYCAMLLADQGADVIKVEPTGSGDATRRSLGEIQPWGESAAFLAVNRNKRSIALDLKQEAGRAVFHRIAATADVVVESYRPGTAERLGIGYPQLAASNERLVYVSISGFGATGPSAARGGYDIILQGASGIMSVTGAEDGEPVKAGVPLTDIGAGTHAAFGAMVALAARERTGRGQLVDTSLFEAGLAYGAWETTELWSSGRVPGALGSAHRMSAPYQAIRVSDGHITIGAFSDHLFAAAATVFDRARWLDDPRFADGPARLAHRAELIAEIEAVSTTDSGAAWLERLHDAGVPAGPVNDYQAATNDPQAQARDMIVELDHPEAGPIKVLGIPVKLSHTPGSIERRPPLLGEHTSEILVEVGLESGEIDDLVQRGVVQQQPRGEG